MTFRPGYAVAAVAVFAVEVAIALWVHDRWVRPHGGDVLAVILVYLVLRAVARLGVVPAAALAFAVASLVEIGQWLDLLHRLGVRPDSVAGTVLGASFDWSDVAAYAGGALLVLAIERWRR